MCLLLIANQFLEFVKLFYLVALNDAQLLPPYSQERLRINSTLSTILRLRFFCRWALNYVKALASLLWQSTIQFFGGRIGAKRSFGRLLVCFIVGVIGSVIFSLYTCLLPRRLISLRQADCGDSDLLLVDTAAAESRWILVHLILGHWVLINLVFHFYRAASMDPGKVPQLPCYVVEQGGGGCGVGMCQRCVLPRPSRAHHCGVCRACILRMDHHCPWLANCVGLHNHRHYLLFLAYLCVGGFYTFAVARHDFAAHFAEIETALVTDQNCTLSTPQPNDNVALATFSRQHAGLAVPQFLSEVVQHCLHKAPPPLSGVLRIHRVLAWLYGLSWLVAVPAGLLCLWQARLVGRGETSIELYLNRRLALRSQQVSCGHRQVCRGFSKKRSDAGAANGVMGQWKHPFDFGLLLNWTRFLGLANRAEELRLRRRWTDGQPRLQ